MEINKAFCLYDHSGRRITVVPRRHLKSNEDFFLDVGVYRENNDEDGWDNITDVPELYKKCNITSIQKVNVSPSLAPESKYRSLLIYINQHEEQLNATYLRAAFFDARLPTGEELIICAWGTSCNQDAIMDLYIEDLVNSSSFSV